MKWKSSKPIGDTVALRRAQSAAGLTTREAADVVHVHERTWRRWVTGERQCPWATLQWFLAVAGQHPRYVLTSRKE